MITKGRIVRGRKRKSDVYGKLDLVSIRLYTLHPCGEEKRKITVFFPVFFVQRDFAKIIASVVVVIFLFFFFNFIKTSSRQLGHGRNRYTQSYGKCLGRRQLNRLFLVQAVWASPQNHPRKRYPRPTR